MTAEDLFNQIPKGHRNALRRPTDQTVDRRLRRLIAKAREEGRIIINSDQGYYEADTNDPIDMMEYHAFIKKQESRIKKIRKGISGMAYGFEMQDRMSLGDIK